MNIKQVSSLINSVVNQMNGTEDVSSVDLQDVVSIGKTVLSSQENIDNFIKTLVDRIGKTIISTRAYNLGDSGIISDDFTFGCILQKIYIEPSEAENSAAWDLESSVDPFIIKKPSVKQKFFDGKNVWQVMVTIPTNQINSAFTSAESLAAFVDAIFLAIQNSLNLHLEAMVNTAYSNFIGEKLADGLGYGETPAHNPGQVVNLLALYKAETGDNTITAAKALRDKDFLKYSVSRINMDIKRLGKMNTLFNSEDFQRHTPVEYLRVNVLSNFAQNVAYYLEADTYHNEFTTLPNYREVMYWQGSGKDYAYEDASMVDITTASGKVVQQNGIICLLNDIEGIALTARSQYSDSIYNPRGRYTNYFESLETQYINDMTEQGIVYLCCDEVAPITTV